MAQTLERPAAGDEVAGARSPSETAAQIGAGRQGQRGQQREQGQRGAQVETFLAQLAAGKRFSVNTLT
ncbi:MAG: hypothetical protein ACRDI2_13075, partial [Chloroflexota bacterium]